MPNSATLEAAIADQLSNRTQSRGGDYLCRRCGGVVPDEFRFVFHLEEDESHVWGPYCSEECICHAKICSGCSRDFIVTEETQIKYFGEGKWYCSECAQNITHCEECNRMTNSDHELREVNGKKICAHCFEHKYFNCTECGEIHHVEDRMKNNYGALEMAQYPTLVDTCDTCFKKLKRTTPALEVTECRRCGGIASNNDTTEGFCQNCIDAGYVIRCIDCGKFESDRKITKNICSACISKYTNCSCCNNLKRKSSMKRINGFKVHYICETCQSKDLEECKNCLKLKPASQFTSYSMSGGEEKKLCEKCSSGVNYCSSCNEFHYNESNCRSSMYDNMNYSYRPTLTFNHADVPQDRIFFGFENEMNYKGDDRWRSALKTIYTNFKASELYCKSDGSISGYGSEVVSMPMNLSYFRKFPVAKMFEVEPKKNDTSCGLHVHVSRSSFISDVHIYKFISMINNGSTSFVKKIAGRSYNSYANKIKGKVSSHMKKGSARKYDAVNLSPKETIEVRIFRGAKNEYQLRYRIEFVHALVNYSRICSLQDAANESKFTAYVVERKNIYPSLARFLG